MKILGFIFFILYFFTIPVKSEENKCVGMKKFSKEFIKCSTLNIKEKTIEYKSYNNDFTTNNRLCKKQRY